MHIYLDDPEAQREAYEERAAIMEYDGGLSREEAEREAWAAYQPRWWIEPPSARRDDD